MNKKNLEKIVQVLGAGVGFAAIGFAAGYTAESFSINYQEFTKEIWNGIYEFSIFFGSLAMLVKGSVDYFESKNPQQNKGKLN